MHVIMIILTSSFVIRSYHSYNNGHMTSVVSYV